ncbi:hypothetical protein [Ilumatobacter sp.]|uniref:hypothetical protein n=1 Tax=Ilumatobacter sp. TaxID=1967498 RepID=UPI003B519348
MRTPSDPPGSAAALGRRAFLIGAATTGVLAACGSDGGDDGGGSAASGDGLAPDTYTVVQRFPQSVAVPGEVRLPFSLAGTDAQFVVDGPSTLGAQVLDADSAPLGPRIEAVRRDVAPAPYYAFRPVVEAPGVYTLVIDGGPPTGAAFQVFASDEVAVPHPGQQLAAFDTPTVGDARGVDPICTRDPACPFHAITLTEALELDRGVVYLVGTPAFCQTGSCTPALEATIEVSEEYADRFAFVHAEVFTDGTATTVAPAVDAVEMTYEPAVFITDATGAIVERLDGLWDATELRERLDAVG